MVAIIEIILGKRRFWVVESILKEVKEKIASLDRLVRKVFKPFKIFLLKSIREGCVMSFSR